MFKIHGFPGIGISGKNGIKGEKGISNNFVKIYSYKDLLSSKFDNDTFYYDEKLNKFYKTDNNDVIQIYSFDILSSYFKSENDIVYTNYNLSLRDTLTFNNNFDKKYSLSLLNSNSECDFIHLETVDKSICTISTQIENNKEFFYFNSKKPFIIPTTLYVKDEDRSILNTFYSELEKYNSNITFNETENDIEIVIDIKNIKNIKNIFNDNIEISIIINGKFNKNFNKECIIKTFNSQNFLINDKVIFHFKKENIKQGKCCLYYKIKTFNKDLSNVYTLYKKGGIITYKKED